MPIRLAFKAEGSAGGGNHASKRQSALLEWPHPIQGVPANHIQFRLGQLALHVGPRLQQNYMMIGCRVMDQAPRCFGGSRLFI